MKQHLSQEPTELYLEAVRQLELWDIDKTRSIVTLLERVIEIDPTFYRAYTTLCKCYIWMGALKQIAPEEVSQKVQHYLSFLKNVDHNISDYYTLLAQRNFWSEWNNSTALRNCNRALKITQNCSDTLLLKGLIYASMGKSEQALVHLFKAERLEPLTKNINYFIGLIYLHKMKLKKALHHLNKNILINPSWHQQFHEKFLVLCHMNRSSEANALLLEIKTENSSTLLSLLLDGQYAISFNKPEKAESILCEIEHHICNTETASPYYSYLAELFIQLGNREKALYYLQKGIEKRATPLTFIKINSLWSDYRSDIQFIQLTQDLFSSKRGKEEKSYEKSLLSKEIATAIKERLEEIMKTDKPWLEASLNRSELSKRVGITPHQLSQVLNREIQCSFHDYCNQFRLQHFLKIASGDKSILSDALDSGFSSKTTFNAYFKKQMGMPPSSYLQQQYPNCPAPFQEI